MVVRIRCRLDGTQPEFFSIRSILFSGDIESNLIIRQLG